MNRRTFSRSTTCNKLTTIKIRQMLAVSFPSAIPNAESQIQSSPAQVERTDTNTQFRNPSYGRNLQREPKPVVMKKLPTLALCHSTLNFEP
jgi:hypothetical protein